MFYTLLNTSVFIDLTIGQFSKVCSLFSVVSPCLTDSIPSFKAPFFSRLSIVLSKFKTKQPACYQTANSSWWTHNCKMVLLLFENENYPCWLLCYHEAFTAISTYLVWCLHILEFNLLCTQYKLVLNLKANTDDFFWKTDRISTQ